jgi:RNA polymerase sigma-70 factor, ECF subfamily
MDHESVVRCLLSERAKILGFTRAVLGGHDGAEDVFQDACLLALSKHAEIKDEQHLLGWLRVTARNLARDYIRARGRGGLVLNEKALDLLESHWREQDQKPARALDALEECVAQLPAKSRDLVQWRYIAGKTVDEIAAALHRPLNSVYVSFSRIHAALADCVQEHLRRVESANTPKTGGPVNG